VPALFENLEGFLLNVKQISTFLLRAAVGEKPGAVG